MYKKLYFLKDLFLKKEDTLQIAFEILQTYQLPNASISENDRLVRYYTESHVRESIDAIFDFSESPIEKIFLNALHISSLVDAPFLFMFVPPHASANVQVYNGQSFYMKINQMWQDFQEKSGEKDIYQFLAATQKRSDLSQEAKSRVEAFVMLNMVDRHNSYYLSMQARFEGFTIRGKTLRPDLFIWVASKPDFRLVVECDGYAYHSDKSAVSNDSARDRLLQSYGFQVFRFSGSEIVSDPIGKGIELYNYLVAKKISTCGWL